MLKKTKTAAATLAVAALVGCGSSVEVEAPVGSDATELSEPWSVLTAITDAQERHFARTGDLCETSLLPVRTLMRPPDLQGHAARGTDRTTGIRVHRIGNEVERFFRHS